MTYEECRETLRSIRRNRSLLRTIERKINEDVRFTFISAIDYSRPVVSGGHKASKQEQYCELTEKMDKNKEALRKQAEKLMIDIFLAEDIINDAMPRLAPLEKEVIIEFYMNGESESAIARSKNYSLSHIKRVKHKAIRKIANSENRIPNDTLFSENP